jgi:arsenate reductase (glutaredoxin)
MLSLHTYQNCSTCRAAVKWLRLHGIAFEEHPIREQPPSPDALRRALDDLGGDLRALFNTSGQDYRSLGLKDKLPRMATDEALRLLAGNGNLVKRPFAQDTQRGLTLVGFKEAAWTAALG